MTNDVSRSCNNLSMIVPQVRDNRAADLRAANSKTNSNSVGDLRKKSGKPPFASNRTTNNKRLDHTSIMNQLQKVQDQSKAFNQMFTTGGRRNQLTSFMIETAAKINDNLLAEMLSFYFQHPQWHSLTFSVAFLNHIQKLLRHRNERFAVVALNFLELLIDSFGSSMMRDPTTSNSKCHTIGVNIAASDRLKCYVRCKNALMQICFNSALIANCLSAENRRRFEQTIQRINQIIGTK